TEYTHIFFILLTTVVLLEDLGVFSFIFIIRLAIPRVNSRPESTTKRASIDSHSYAPALLLANQLVLSITSNFALSTPAPPVLRALSTRVTKPRIFNGRVEVAAAESESN